MSNRLVTYTLQLNSNVKQSLQQHEAQALRLDGAMQSLNNTLRQFGLGFAGHAILNAAKEWTDGAATYEDAVNRIRFASDNLEDGAKNVAFIRHEVDKFRIPLQQATDDYGAFLAMVQGSGMAIDKVQDLHDKLLLIGKIKHLDAGQLSAGVMNLGKMMEAGAMDARHLKPLEMQLSGIGAFIAKEMGISVHELAKLRNDGKLTGVDPSILLSAVSKQAASLEQHLPEAILSTRSELNELSNQWLEFKNDTVLGLKPELIELFSTFKEGIAWLKENREGLVKLGGALVDIGKLYLQYKVAMFAVNSVSGIYKGWQMLIYGNTTKLISSTGLQTKSYQSQSIAVKELTASIERMNYVQNAQNGAFITNSAGVTMANTVGNRYASTFMNTQIAQQKAFANSQRLANGAFGLTPIVTQQSAMRGFSAPSALTNSLNSIDSAASRFAPVGIVFMAASVASIIANAASNQKEYNNSTDAGRFEMEKKSVLEKIKDYNSIFSNQNSPFNILLKGNQFQNSKDAGSFTLQELVQKHPEILQDTEYINEIRRILERTGKEELTNVARDLGFVLDKERDFLKDYIGNTIALFNGASSEIDKDWKGFPYSAGIKKTDKEKDFKIGKIDDHKNIRGNSVTNVNITFHDMIGIQTATFSVKNGNDLKQVEEMVGNVLTKRLSQVVNDSQIVGQK